MVSRKRDRREMESAEPPPEPSTLDRIRNMWQFANLMQYIFIFGKVVKIEDEFDIEDLETELLKPSHSQKLSEIGLALLKFVSSHRGLTPELFDEYTRRQYQAKLPTFNPFGDDEEPKKFSELDVFTKVKVLYQLSQWTLVNSERIRERMPEVKDTEQTQWRVEEVGYDAQDRLYYVLDDNRLYRRTDPPTPTPKPKANSKKARAAARASKRRRVSKAMSTDGPENEDGDGTPDKVEAADDGFGGMKWECLAVTLKQYQNFLESIRRSKDPNEKYLHDRLTEEVLPVIEKFEEEQKRKALKREKELLNLQKLATAKRSSRIASKIDRQREEEAAAEAEKKRQALLVEAKKEKERRKKMEEERDHRMMTRERRLRDREHRRILHEEELANLSEENEMLEKGLSRKSERHIKLEMEKAKLELEKLAEEDNWIFDCSVCGVYGDNLDDGSHSVACDKCNVWQHSACLGISQQSAEREDFHFICKDCKRRIEDAKKPKIPSLKFHVGLSSSPPTVKTKSNGEVRDVVMTDDQDADRASASPTRTRQVTSTSSYGGNANPSGIMNGPSLSPHGQSPGPPGVTNGVGVYPTSTPNGTTHLPPSTLFGLPNGNPSRPSTSGDGIPHFNSSLSNNGVKWYDNEDPHGNTPSRAQNPFLDSLDRQRPSSSHSVPDLPSPIKNQHSMSPAARNKDVGPLAFPGPGSPNGTFVPPAAQPPSHSPMKHSSSPIQMRFSSPSAIPPASSGISPIKHSPPRPGSGYGISGTPILPPIASLSPSPSQQILSAPSKVLTPEQAKTDVRHIGQS
ncbi:MAG: hypothetical protein M1819_000136 [Sarea resinae]|nr:MAG: hypothetical protein M1819_000136 [Sarea resinae]